MARKGGSCAGHNIKNDSNVIFKIVICILFFALGYILGFIGT